MVSRLTRILCAVLGGHDWQGPRYLHGRVRMVCGLGCGAMSRGVEVGPQARKVVPINLLLVRGSHRKRKVA